MQRPFTSVELQKRNSSRCDTILAKAMYHIIYYYIDAYYYENALSFFLLLFLFPYHFHSSEILWPCHSLYEVFVLSIRHATSWLPPPPRVMSHRCRCTYVVDFVILHVFSFKSCSIAVCKSVKLQNNSNKIWMQWCNIKQPGSSFTTATVTRPVTIPHLPFK